MFRPGQRVRGCQIKPTYPGYNERCNWLEGTFTRRDVVPIFEPKTPFEKSLHSYIDKELARG